MRLELMTILSEACELAFEVALMILEGLPKNNQSQPSVQVNFEESRRPCLG